MLPLVGGLTGALALTGMAVAPAANATGHFEPKGSAFALKSEVSLLNGVVGLRVAPLPKAAYPAGADKSLVEISGREVLKHLQATKNSNLQLRTLNASSDLKGGKLHSHASVEDLKANLEKELTLSAQLVEANCVATPDGTTGSSNLVDVRVGGEIINSKVKVVNPNTVVEVRGVGKVVLNEQKWGEDGLTVNAIHVKLDPALGLAKGDIIVSQAKCSGKPGGGPATGPVQPGDPGDGGPSDGGSGKPSDGSGKPADNGNGNDNGSGTSTNPPAGTGDNGDTSGDNTQNSSLAKTGANGLLPIAGAAAGLVVLGGGALFLARRRKAGA